jgi:Bacterial regulatory proteins, tetR family
MAEDPLKQTGGQTRRRGAALEEAILRAAVDELTESGYAGLTMDKVASRAGTNKNSITAAGQTASRSASPPTGDWPRRSHALTPAACAATSSRYYAGRTATGQLADHSQTSLMPSMISSRARRGGWDGRGSGGRAERRVST